MQQQADEFSRSIIGALHRERADLFASDLLRSFIYIALALTVLVLYTKNKLKSRYAIAAILILGSADLIGVANRYLNYRNFTELATAEAVFNTNPAIEKIKADPAHNHFRVYDQAEFTSSTTSYYFNSIGGYSPAKLGLYQDIIANQLSKGNMNVFNPVKPFEEKPEIISLCKSGKLGRVIQANVNHTGDPCVGQLCEKALC